jgi:hypothetical protein
MLKKLLGERVTLFCANYFYTGRLIGVDETCVLLEDPAIVYETGPFTDAKWKDAQRLNVKTWYVQRAFIESFGVLK